MKSPLVLSALSVMAAVPTALSQCLNCTSTIGNSNWANGLLPQAGDLYYQPTTPLGIWALGQSTNGYGNLELRRDPSGFNYIWNQCPTGHSGYCRTYFNQVVRVTAGETYNIYTEYQMTNVRNNVNTLELYVETLPSRSRLFGEFIYAGNTGWTSWTTGTWTATVTGNVVFTFTYRNDPNNAVVFLRRIDMKPVACRAPNPNTSCAPTSTSTTSTTSSDISTTSPTSILTTSSASSSTLSTSTLSSVEPTYTPPYPPVDGYNWVDCWKEPESGQRLLRGAMTASDDMTLEKCAAFCTAWPYFGTEYARECFCGLSLNDGAAPAPLSDCSSPCSGNSSQVCGAGGRLSLYNHPAKHPSNPEEVVVNGGPSKRLGCATDTREGRTLGLAATASDQMTLEMCDAFCQDYALWGVEYGRECYCGNELRQGSELVAKEECEMLCTGNSLQLCGAGDRVMVYSRQPVTSQPSAAPTA